MCLADGEPPLRDGSGGVGAHPWRSDMLTKQALHSTSSPDFHRRGESTGRLRESSSLCASGQPRYEKNDLINIILH